jgi:hypothetical protein
MLNTTLVNVQLASGVIPGMIENSILSATMINIVVDQAPVSTKKVDALVYQTACHGQTAQCKSKRAVIFRRLLK